MKIILENDIAFKDSYIPNTARDVEDYQADLLNIFDVLVKYDILSSMDMVTDGYHITIFSQTIEILDENMLQFFNDLLILQKYGFNI